MRYLHENSALKQALVEFDGVVKAFAARPRLLSRRPRNLTTAVRGVWLTIGEGEILGLVGESGSGKTTLGRCAVGLETPTDGEVRYRGQVISSLPRAAFHNLRRDLQIVFQDTTGALDPRQTVMTAVEEPLKCLGSWDKAARATKVLEILNEVGLNRQLFGRYRHQLSGGQRQLVNIARALVVEPRFIVLDEPVSSLDASARDRVVDLLVRLHEGHGIAYLYITHDLETARSICHRIAIMFRGVIVELGPTAAIFGEPMHPYTRLLLSSSLRADTSHDRARRDGGGSELRTAILTRRALIEEVQGLGMDVSKEGLANVGSGHYVRRA